MRYILFFLLPFILLIVGCRTPKPATGSSTIQGIEVEVWANKDCAEPGEMLTLRATATNRSSVTRTMQLNDAPVLALSVQTDSNITRWSESNPLAPDLTHMDLKPGEAKAIQMNWKVACCAAIRVSAEFAYNENFGVSPSTVVFVQKCAGPLGP